MAVKQCPPAAAGIDSAHSGWLIKVVARVVVGAGRGYRLTDRLRIVTEVPWLVLWMVNRATAALIIKMPR